MILVISSPSSSTSGFCTLTFGMFTILVSASQSPAGASRQRVASNARRCYLAGNRPRGQPSASLPYVATISQAPSESAAWQTHTVFNQAPPLQGVNVFSSNVALVEATEREGAGWVCQRASELGQFVGGAPQQEWGRLANENPPRLRTHDRYGHRIDEVEFHPAWHDLMATAVTHGLHAAPWQHDQPGAHVARAA